MPLSNRKKLTVVLLAPLLALGVFELALRVAGFRYEPETPALIVRNAELDSEMESGDDLHAFDEICLWSPRAGAEVVPGEVINPERLRGPLVPDARRAGVGRVLLLGESSMFGMGVPYADTLAGRLPDEMLERGLEIEVINGAVIGHSVWQSLARYEHDLRRKRPDVCVAAFGVVNEHFAAHDLADEAKLAALTPARGRLARVLTASRGVLRSLQWLAWVGDDREPLDLVTHDLPKDHLARRKVVGRRDFSGVRRVSLESFARGLHAFERALAADGVQLVLVSMPRKPPMEQLFPVLADYSAAIVDFSRETQVPVVPFRRWMLQAHPTRESAEPFFLPDQRLHPSAAGHAQAAAMIAERIEAPLRLRLDAR